jgi:hypothetical protein
MLPSPVLPLCVQSCCEFIFCAVNIKLPLLDAGLLVESLKFIPIQFHVSYFINSNVESGPQFNVHMLNVKETGYA